MQTKFILNEKTGNYSVNRVLSKEDIMNMAFHIAEESMSTLSFTSAHATSDHLRAMLMNETREVFGCLFMDSQHGLIKAENLFFGTINSAAVYPREIVKRSLELGAAALILYHNHPSGQTEPSRADINITEKIKQALNLIDLTVLDHFIVGKEGTTSFAQRGLL